MLLYHFTSVYHLPFIEEDGFLKLVESNISMTEPHAGPDVVWLTTRHSRRRQPWSRGSLVDKTEVRITLNVEDALWWPTWSRQQGITKQWYEALDASGGYGAQDWYVVERRVLVSEFLEVEVSGDRSTRS